MYLILLEGIVGSVILFFIRWLYEFIQREKEYIDKDMLKIIFKKCLCLKCV
jgi:hypothetical protein